MNRPWTVMELGNARDLVILDREDYLRLRGFNWVKQRAGYAMRRMPTKKGEKQRFVLMHREILGFTDPSVKTDHKNGDRLDNRRSNLRPCTDAENRRNQSGQSNRRSRFKGVYRDLRTGARGRAWYAQIKVSGRRFCLGSFHTEAEAAIAYNRAALIHHGEFARLNEAKEPTP